MASRNGHHVNDIAEGLRPAAWIPILICVALLMPLFFVLSR